MIPPIFDEGKPLGLAIILPGATKLPANHTLGLARRLRVTHWRRPSCGDSIDVLALSWTEASIAESGFASASPGRMTSAISPMFFAKGKSRE